MRGMSQTHDDVRMEVDALDDAFGAQNNPEDQRLQANALTLQQQQQLLEAPSPFEADHMMALHTAMEHGISCHEDLNEVPWVVGTGAEDFGEGDAPSPQPPDALAGLSSARQRPVALRDQDNRGLNELVAAVKDHPGYLSRLEAVVGARAAQPQTPAVASFQPEPEEAGSGSNRPGGDDDDAGDPVDAAWRDMFNEQKKAEVAKLLREERDRTVNVQKIFKYLLSQTELPPTLADNVTPNPRKLSVRYEGAERKMVFVDDDAYKWIMSDEDRRLSSRAKAIWKRYEHGTWEDPGLDLQPTEMDKINSGLKSDAREVSEAKIRIPGVFTFGAHQMHRYKCAFGCDGCEGKAAYVQMLIHIYETEKVRIAGRKVKDDDKTPEGLAAIAGAETIIVNIVKGLGNIDDTYKSMLDRVEATACCRNGNCKLAAGLWEIEEKAEQNAKDEQHANQKNSNKRYHSDVFFYNEMKLANRLVRKDKLSVAQAERMVLDTTMFSYWVESRLQQSITAVVEFAYNAPKYGLQWDLAMRQEAVDLVSKVPWNHAVHIMSKHVCDTRTQPVFGYYEKQGWDGYLKWSLGKVAFPDPYTAIYVLIKVFNWVAEGMPVRLKSKDNNGQHEEKLLRDEKVKEEDILELIDRVAADNTGKPILCGVARDGMTPARYFSNLLWKDMEYRARNEYELEYAAADADLDKQGAAPDTYRRNFQKAMRSAGGSDDGHKLKATELAMLTSWMRANASEEDAKQTLPTWVRTNGDRYKNGMRLTPFGPSSSCCFLNSAHCNRGKIEHAAEAMGLSARFWAVLPHFSTHWIQHLFLRPCRDRYNKSNGHKIMPSLVYQVQAKDGSQKQPWELKRKGSSLPHGADGAQPVGGHNRDRALHGAWTDTVRGKVSHVGVDMNPVLSKLGREHHEIRDSDLSDATRAALPAEVLGKIEAQKEEARTTAYDSYVDCLKQLTQLRVRPESPATVGALGAASARWLGIDNGNTVALMNATATLLRLYEANFVECVRGAAPSLDEEALAQAQEAHITMRKALLHFHNSLLALDPTLDPALKIAVQRRTPLWAREHGITELASAPNAEASRLCLDNYERLANGDPRFKTLHGREIPLHACIDKERFAYEDYAINSTKRREMEWHIQEQQARHHWFEYIKKLHPDQVGKIADGKKITEEWDLKMSNDPLDEKAKAWTITDANGEVVEVFTVATVADYQGYVKAVHQQAKTAVVSLWLDRKKKIPNPAYVPDDPPCFFEYWCDQQGINPKERWPKMRDLREQYANKIKRENEVKIRMAREGVKAALYQEKQRLLSQLPAGASQKQKEEHLTSIWDHAPSVEWTTSKKSFDEKSKHADTKLRDRLGRWVNDDIDWPEETPDEAELIANIERGFARDLELRFGGGLAHAHEQQRMQSATTSFNSLEENRELLRAELALAKKSTERAERAHKAAEARHADLTGVSVGEAEVTSAPTRDVADVIAELMDPRAQVDAAAAAAAASEREVGAKNSLDDFDPTIHDFSYKSNDDEGWVQWRLDDCSGWCDPKTGWHAVKPPPSKRSKRAGSSAGSSTAHAKS